MAERHAPCPGGGGPQRSGEVGPKTASTGVPTAVARCTGPESQATSRSTAARPAASPSTGRRVRSPSIGARQAARKRPAPRRRPGPPASTMLAPRAASASATAAKRSAAQSLVAWLAPGATATRGRRAPASAAAAASRAAGGKRHLDAAGPVDAQRTQHVGVELRWRGPAHRRVHARGAPARPAPGVRRRKTSCRARRPGPRWRSSPCSGGRWPGRSGRAASRPARPPRAARPGRAGARGRAPGAPPAAARRPAR